MSIIHEERSSDPPYVGRRGHGLAACGIGGSEPGASRGASKERST
jgi:hypothetical protein